MGFGVCVLAHGHCLHHALNNALGLICYTSGEEYVAVVPPCYFSVAIQNRIEKLNII